MTDLDRALKLYTAGVDAWYAENQPGISRQGYTTGATMAGLAAFAAERAGVGKDLAHRLERRASWLRDDCDCGVCVQCVTAALLVEASAPLAPPIPATCGGALGAAKPFLDEIDRLEREYGFDRPMHQGQCLMLALSDLIAFRAAFAALSPTPVAGGGEQ